MYRFSLKLKPEVKDRLKKVQKEFETILGTRYSLNTIIEAILTQGLNRLESTK